MMRTIWLFTFIISLFNTSFGQNAYFFGNTTFDPQVPSPEKFLGYPIGKHHTRYDKMIEYYRMLEKNNSKVKVFTMGYTNEHREQVLVAFGNINKLENLKKTHKEWAHGNKANINEIPLVVWLGYNVHGNEASGAEAALLTGYYLVAANSPEINKYFDEAVFLIEPVLNPDGRDRFSQWVNMYKANPMVSDPNDREHNEAWPSGRVNHYWFDLNRDWYPLTQIESQNRINFYHEWMPNVVTDFHEMGTNSTHFFEPTKNTAENPLVPSENYKLLNETFAVYFEKAMNQIGSLYFTKESFDNFYPGYGSTYPDVEGGLGILFEQGSSRGHIQNSENGILTFDFAVRNQLTNALATIKAAVENKKMLLEYQNSFFAKVKNESLKTGVKAYVFGSNSDHNRTQSFVELLLKHKIKVYGLTANQKTANYEYTKGNSFIVPSDQDQVLLIRSIFEKPRQFADSIFYDTSAWNMALAYGLENSEIKTPVTLGPEITDAKTLFNNFNFNQSDYAYLIDWRQYNSAKAVYALLKNEVIVKSAMKPFRMGQNDWPQGTIMISVKQQKLSETALYQLLSELSEKNKIKISGVSTGLSQKGIDLGSNSFRTIKLPKPVMIIGQGISQYEAGEVWHLTDSKLEIPLTKVDIGSVNRINLYDYTHLIMVSGNYESLNEIFTKKLKEWVRSGGVIISQKSACDWLIKNEFSSEKILKNDEKIPVDIPFESVNSSEGARTTGGAIFETEFDLTHPLAFGLEKPIQYVYKNSNLVFEASKTPGSTVAKYTKDSWVSGYVHPINRNRINKSPSFLLSGLGSGKIVLFADNPNFRSYWYGTSRLFFNALFLSSTISESRFGEAEE